MIVVCDERYELTEAPLYFDGSFYWVDIINGVIFELPTSGAAAPKEIAAYPGELVSNIAVFGRSELLVTGEHCFYRLEKNVVGLLSLLKHRSVTSGCVAMMALMGPTGSFTLGRWKSRQQV